MKKYWNKRFNNGKKIWGSFPSQTAVKVQEFFSKENIKTVFVPGSGYGRNSEYFAQKGYETTDLEISEEAIKYMPQDKKGIYYQGDVFNMSVLSNQIFDAIYCFNVLRLFKKDKRYFFIEKCINHLKDGGFIFFAVFSEKEPSYGKGRKVEDNTFESKPGRPVHYFSDEDLRSYFTAFNIIETGIIEDPENHGEQGPHTHILRFIFAQKDSHYEFDGEKYKKASSHQYEWGINIIKKLRLSENATILDLGCGDGRLTAKIAEIVPDGKVIGIDSSRGMMFLLSSLTLSLLCSILIL